MGYTINFTDNQVISADSLNEVASGIDDAQEGFNEFSEGVNYGVDSLNSITKSLVTKGVSYGCDVTKQGEDVFISQGILFFEDGKKMTIDADGITISCLENGACFVYVLNEAESGIVSAKCTQELPDGDVVLLAEINEKGVISLKKDIALMKNASLLPNCYTEITVDFSKKAEYKECTLDLGGNYRRMVLVSEQRMIFIDWDKNKWMRDKNHYVEEFYISEENIPILTFDNDASVRILSFENNILTYGATSRYGGGSFKIWAM